MQPLPTDTRTDTVGHHTLQACSTLKQAQSMSNVKHAGTVLATRLVSCMLQTNWRAPWVCRAYFLHAKKNAHVAARTTTWLR